MHHSGSYCLRYLCTPILGSVQMASCVQGANEVPWGCSAAPPQSTQSGRPTRWRHSLPHNMWQGDLSLQAAGVGLEFLDPKRRTMGLATVILSSPSTPPPTFTPEWAVSIAPFPSLLQANGCKISPLSCWRTWQWRPGCASQVGQFPQPNTHTHQIAQACKHWPCAKSWWILTYFHSTKLFTHLVKSVFISGKPSCAWKLQPPLTE